MTDIPYRIALIVGAGSGISASLARGLAAAGLRVGLAARNVDKLAALASETGAATFPVDASDLALSLDCSRRRTTGWANPTSCISTPAPAPTARLRSSTRRPCARPSRFRRLAVLTVREAARRMIPHGRGAILLTGASASVKGYPHSAAFAMGKFALRGLAQSTARELGPKGIHVAHFVIDGGVRSAGGRIWRTVRTARSILARSRRPIEYAATAQRLVFGGRAAALGRDLLKAGQDDRAVYPLCRTLAVSICH